MPKPPKPPPKPPRPKRPRATALYSPERSFPSSVFLAANPCAASLRFERVFYPHGHLRLRCERQDIAATMTSARATASSLRTVFTLSPPFPRRVAPALLSDGQTRHAPASLRIVGAASGSAVCPTCNGRLSPFPPRDGRETHDSCRCFHRSVSAGACASSAGAPTTHHDLSGADRCGTHRHILRHVSHHVPIGRRGRGALFGPDDGDRRVRHG